MNKEEIIWSVSDVNSAIRELVENSLMPFWLRGEVSNLTLHRSGHVYLSLKDAKSQIRAVFFGGAAMFHNLKIESGMQIEAGGKLTVYESRGEYQFSIREVRVAGIGDMQRRFEELKKKLAEEGLFDADRKKPIPLLPRRIGLITSPTGAAIRDFLNIVNRRFPDARVRIYPCLVQGAKAAASVAAGIRFFNRSNAADVLIVTRGGGSMEDLWPFNEEILVREVAASRIPVISAVGHEIDFTLCDFVADLRVPTPSAAAELVIGEREKLRERLAESTKHLKNAMQLRLLGTRQSLLRAEHCFNIDNLRHLLQNAVLKLDDLDNRVMHAIEKRRITDRARLELAAGKLESFKVETQLARGFAILTDGAGQIVKSRHQPPGKLLKARLADGELNLQTVEPGFTIK